MISLIAAVSRNGVIGNAGKIPWHLPEDLKRFKQATTGHVLIMGRKTYESIGKPLPNRTTIVLTRDRNRPTLHFDFGDEWASKSQFNTMAVVRESLEEALRYAGSLKRDNSDELRDVFICGGTEVYRAALNADIVDRLLLTHIDADYEGDAFLPEIDYSRWESPFRGEQLSSRPANFPHKWWHLSWQRRRA